MLFNLLLLLFIKRQLDLFTLNFEIVEFKSHFTLFKSEYLVLNSILAIFKK